MEWNFDKIWEELEALETMSPKKKNDVKDNLVSAGICGMKYFRFTPFKSEVTTNTYWMRQEEAND